MIHRISKTNQCSGWRSKHSSLPWGIQDLTLNLAWLPVKEWYSQMKLHSNLASREEGIPSSSAVRLMKNSLLCLTRQQSNRHMSHTQEFTIHKHQISHPACLKIITHFKSRSSCALQNIKALTVQREPQLSQIHEFSSLIQFITRRNFLFLTQPFQFSPRISQIGINHARHSTQVQDDL